MATIIWFLVGAVLGFGAGFLVFRNNQQKLNEIEAAAKK